MAMETPVKSFARPTPRQGGFRTKAKKFRKCVVCLEDLLLAKKYYVLQYCGPDNQQNLADRIADILGTDTDSVTSRANHICCTCKRKVENVKKGTLTPDAFKELYNEALKGSFTSYGQEQQQKFGTASPKPHNVLVSKRMAKSPGKMRKRRHLDFEAHGSDENIHPQSRKDQTFQSFLDQIQEECQKLCQPSFNSTFRRTDLSSLLDWSHKEQEEELKNHAPTLFQALQAAAVNPKAVRKKDPQTQNTPTGIVSAAGILLYSRNQYMNAQQTMTGLILKRSSVGKAAYRRLHSRSLVVSYSTVLRKQTEFGANHDQPVKEWKEIETDARLQMDTSVAPEKDPHPGFKIVGDNVDIRIKPRFSTISDGNKDLHYYNFMAVKHRIPADNFDNSKPKGTVDSVPWSEYLPTAEDNKSLKEEWNYLIGRTIANNIPHFEWMKPHLADHMDHEYSDLTRRKTEVVNLGIIMENENTNEGMATILSETHKYVPQVDGIPEKVLSGGDLLTCERQLNAQEDRADSDDPLKRWGGLVPTIEDFHTFVNFCEVIWGTLYSTLSSGDTGTLYSSRNFLRAHNVSSDPFKNVNACTDLLEKYTTMLTVTAALEFFGMESVQGTPTKHAFDHTTDPKVYITETFNALLEQYAIHDGPDVREPVELACSDCTKKYKTLRGLQNHRKAKHPVHGTAGHEYSSDQDSVFNYSCCALSLCLMAQDFTDARKHGDGARIVRLHKFLLLYFKMAGKTKYAYHCLHLLMQVNCLLTPKLSHQLTWNRFVNNSGRADTNVEMDREMEHHNRVFKEECRGFRGKVTDPSVKRVGNAAQRIDSVLKAYDSSYQIRRPSGRHTKKDSKKDVMDLIEHVHKEHIFRQIPGRIHFAFPAIGRNPLQQMDLAKLQTWMKKTTRDISRKHLYSTTSTDEP